MEADIKVSPDKEQSVGLEIDWKYQPYEEGRAICIFLRTDTSETA